MAVITYQEQRYVLRAGETVLDGLTRHGVRVPSACRSGICRSCMMQSLDAPPPGAAQRGLSPAQRDSGHFLACQCRARQDMAVALPGGAELPEVTMEIAGKRLLSPRVMHLQLRPPGSFAFKAGQFLNLTRGGVTRSYSIANAPAPDGLLSLHVYAIDGGRMSGWLHDEAAAGDRVTVQGPLGECTYPEEPLGQPLLLIGTGCGLAPLRGIVHQALAAGHAGPIHLFHGSRNRDGVYLEDEMRDLSRRHPHFHYTACLSGDDPPAGYTPGRAADIALARHAKLKGWRVYLCGNAAMVKAAKKRAFLAGAARGHIHADPFEFSP